jgi:hypothetical protein
VIVNAEVEIDRPCSEVFTVMADARNEPARHSQVSQTELLSGELRVVPCWPHVPLGYSWRRPAGV